MTSAATPGSSCLLGGIERRDRAGQRRVAIPAAREAAPSRALEAPAVVEQEAELDARHRGPASAALSAGVSTQKAVASAPASIAPGDTTVALSTRPAGWPVRGSMTCE